MQHLFSFRQRPNETLTHSTTRGLNGSRMVVETTVKGRSNDCRPTLGRLSTLLLLLFALSFGFNQEAKANFPANKVFYFDASGNTNWTQANFNVKFNWYWDSGNFNTDTWCKTKVPGTTWIYYTTSPNTDYNNGVQLCRMDPSDDGKQWNCTSQATGNDRGNNNCLYCKSENYNWWDTWVPGWKTYVPPMKSLSIANNGTTIVSGSGTQASPYIIAAGATIKVKATAAMQLADPNPTFKYKYKVDGVEGSYGDGNNTYQFTAGTEAHTYAVTVRAYATYNSTDNAAIDASNTIYFKVPSYTITYDPATASHFTYTTAPTSGTYNTNVAMEFTPDANYVIASVTAYKTGASSTAVTVTKTDDTHYSFTQPAYAVTVKVEVSLSSVQVTYGKSGNGTIVGKVEGTDIGTSPASVDGGATVVFTATPSANYTVEGWYANSSCTGDKLLDGDNTGAAKTYTIPNIAEDRTVYVKFRETTRTISVANGTGISSVSPTSTNAYVTTKSADISATLKDGYRDLVWNLGSGITVAGGYTTSSNPIKVNATADGTLTANATEILHSVTMASSDDNKGTVAITSTQKQAGIATPISIKATPKAGYYFTGWTASDGSKVTFGNSKSETTTAKVTADGITITANFAGKYAFRGSLNDGQDTPGGMPGWSTTTPIDFADGTATVTFNEIQANKQYKFQLYNLENNSWVGYQDNTNPIPLNDNAYHLFNGTNWVKLNTQGAGSYQFDIAFEGTTPKVKVSGPTSYKITFGKGTGGNSISATSSIDGTITTGQYVKSGANVTFSQTAGTGYHFVEWNTKSDKSGTQLGTDATLVLNNVTANKTVYSIYAKTDYNITYPSGTNYTIEKTKDIANYLDNVTFKATPKDGYRLEVTAKDASNNNVTLNHNDFSYDYSFSMPASNVTISVTEYPYKIGGNFVNGGGSADFDANKYDFDENHQHTFSLNAQTSYKFKIYNDNYRGQADHYMGMKDDWEIDHTTLNSEVTCAGAACFVIKTGIAGQYTIKVKTGANNKPVVDIIYPNVSKLVYNGTDYPFTEVSSGVYKAGPLSLAANTTLSNNIQMYWEGTCIKNNYDGTMSASSHTDWVMERYTSGTYYIRITTAGDSKTFAKNPDDYYFYYKPDGKKLTAEYPSYWRGDDGTTLGWNYDHPMEFVNDVATIELNVQTSGERQMKVIVDGQYWTYTGDAINTSTNNIQFEKDADVNKAAFKFNVASSMTGTYTFTFNRSNHQMSVNYPDTEQFEITYTDAEGTKTIMAGPHGGRGISAANKPGYRFTGWVISPDNTYLTVADNDLSRQTTTVYGKKDGGSLTATYSNDEFIYFKNIPGWSDVNVYFYNADYFDKNNGSGCLPDKAQDKRKAQGYAMTHIPNTDIWYLDYKDVSWKPGDSHIVAFSDHLQNDNQWFYECQVAYRKDFSSCTPMYMPVNWIHERLNGGRTAYYEQGCWMKYDNQESGYEVKLYDKITGDGNEMAHVDLNADGAGGYVFTGTININFDGKSEGYNYGFKIKNKCNSTYFGNNGTMTSSNCTNWEFNSASDMQNCGLTTTTKGNYAFTISFDGGIMHVSVEYPVSNGDYRVVYKEGSNAPIWNGFYYKKSATDRKDTASFFIKNDVNATVELQRGTNVSANPAVWDKVADINTSSLATGVYNFEVSQTNEGADATLTSKGLYTGNYYIRTDGVDGGWKGYAKNPDNLMTYYGSMLDAGVTYDNFQYDYYKTKWIEYNKNVKFCIANDYSKNISAEFADDATLKDKQVLPQNANVRFMWNSATNQLSRAYISGSTDIAARFLVMIGDNKMFDKDGKALTEVGGGKIPGLNDYELNFADKNNWVYQADIMAQPGCAVQLIATYNGETQYFIGSNSEPRPIISGGEDDTQYTMRAVYDFKTNRLIVGWIPPEGEITKDITLGGDILLIRTHQEDVQQIVFSSPATKVSEIQHIYGVLTLKKDQMIGTNNTNYAQTMYWISFPFDVKLSQVFGTGIYGTDWIVQRYRGDLRAQKGWFKQDTPTFWEYMEPTDTLKAYEGYVFLVDANKFNTNSAEAWKNSATEANFYFPSASESIGIIHQDSYTQPVPEHVCKIDREFEVEGAPGTLNHKITDSHWNVIGVPAFQNNIPSASPTYGDFNSYYEWNPENNKYLPKVVMPGTTALKTMHAYMVQFAGEITWSDVSIVKQNAPSRELAAQYADAQSYLITLRINDGKDDDQTYIRLSEKADADFVLNEDMMKLDNTGFPNIYSFAGNYNVAYNETGMENQTINLGVNVPKNGNYTFSMPDNFNGSATLVDMVEGKVTELNVSDYTVTLNKGTYNNRFQLVLTVNSPIVTNVDEINNGWNTDGKTKKLLINNTIYLINGGRIYNASGMELNR